MGKHTKNRKNMCQYAYDRVFIIAFLISIFKFLNIVLVLPLFCRSETKLWSPLSSERGKTNPYKMNLASEPKVCV